MRKPRLPVLYAVVIWVLGMMTVGPYSAQARGVIQNGLYKIYDKEGNVLFVESYKDFQRDGIVYTYHENGDVAEARYYDHGKRHGVMRTFYEDGRLAGESLYYRGYEIPEPEAIVYDYD